VVSVSTDNPMRDQPGRRDVLSPACRNLASIVGLTLFTFRARHAALLAVLFFSLQLSPVVQGQDPAVKADGPGVKESNAQRSDTPEPAVERARVFEPQPDGRLTPRQRAVMVGAVLLALVLILAVAMIAFIIMLGQRTRRLAGPPLPDSAPRDELWYLRQNRSPPAGRSPTSGEARDDDSTDRPGNT